VLRSLAQALLQLQVLQGHARADRSGLLSGMPDDVLSDRLLLSMPA
jgi:hypothetical protein